MKRLDMVEGTGLFLGGLLVAVLIGQLMPPPALTLANRAVVDELAPFVARYGTPHYSSHEEELFVRDFFRDRRDGVFVDVGAGHYRDRSNTFYLEERLGWSGLAIDAQAKFADDYRRFRARSKFFALFVSDASDQQAKLFIGKNDLFSSSNRDFTEGWVPVAGETTVPTITLNDLLVKTGIERVDFLSMDIELAEPKALAGFDVRRYAPALVGIEAHPQVRQVILDYFHHHGYVVVGKYLRADPQNLWFTPGREMKAKAN